MPQEHLKPRVDFVRFNAGDEIPGLPPERAFPQAVKPTSFCDNVIPGMKSPAWSFYIFSSGSRLNQLCWGEFKGEAMEQCGLLGDFLA